MEPYFTQFQASFLTNNLSAHLKFHCCRLPPVNNLSWGLSTILVLELGLESGQIYVQIADLHVMLK
jgi:hypothetical protein